MGKAISAQHPAAVLRSHFKLVRALLAVAMIAVVGLTVAVVIVANDGEQVSSTSAAKPAEANRYGDLIRPPAGPTPAPSRTRGRWPSRRTPATTAVPKEGTRGAPSSGAASSAAPRHPLRRRPEEGTAALTKRPTSATLDPTSIDGPRGERYDGGPEEGTRGSGH